MKSNTKVSTFVAAFIFACLIFSISSTDISKAEPIPIPAPGCCTTQEDGGQCVGCPEGEECQASGNFCNAEGGFFSKGTCFDDGGGAVCGDGTEDEGCCVIEAGSCSDDVNIESCFLGTPGGPELFVRGASCSVVPQCTVTRNIPTMSNWGLIALAGIFILVGIWAITKKKAEA